LPAELTTLSSRKMSRKRCIGAQERGKGGPARRVETHELGAVAERGSLPEQ
jgi:hypothetical protein